MLKLGLGLYETKHMESREIKKIIQKGDQSIVEERGWSWDERGRKA